MTNWILFGGCLLGLFGVEQARQLLFPGERPLWGWRLGRTRRQEKLTRGDSVTRITPQFVFSPDRILPKYSEHLSALETRSPMELEESLRKELFETKDRYPRLLLTGLLAQASLHLNNREEAHALIEEAEENLHSDWSNLDPEFLGVAENLMRIKALIFFQEGNCPIVLDILSEIESLFGDRQWVHLLRAETFLLRGSPDRCQSILLPYLKRQTERTSSSPTIYLPAGAWAILAESYFREFDWQKLDRVLATCEALKKLPIHDRAAVLRLKVELSIRDGDAAQAWRTVGEFHSLVEKNSVHRGLVRGFQLACARVHTFEGQWTEALRRLQLAENESRYPAAHWEVDFFRALALEGEQRYEEASQTWRRLAVSATGTHFGKTARDHLVALEGLAPPPMREPSLPTQFA